MNKFKYLLEYFNNVPFVIQVVLLASCFLFCTIIILMIYLKLLRTHLRSKEKITARFSNKNEVLLITYLYAESESDGVNLERKKVIDKLKRGITNTFKREVIISSLLKLKNEISGEMEDSIQDLYSEIGLKDYALTKLHEKKWDVIAGGIRELTLFNVKEAHSEIIKHINHPKREIRKEVQLYLVNLFNFEGLVFLNNLKTSLTEWDQIQLLEELQKFDNQQIPDISQWLKSDNDSVVLFALKLAKIYNQFETKDLLIDMLNHKSQKVRLALIPVLDYLLILESKEVLKNNFSKRSRDEKIAIFKLLENLAEASDEPFILQYIRHEIFEIRLSALKILKSINLTKFESLEATPPESEFVKTFNFLKNN